MEMVSSTPCLQRRDSPEQGKCARHYGVSHARTYTEVRVFCGLSGHYHHFIKNFAHLAHVLYDLLGDEVKMGPLMLTPEAEEAVRVLKEKISSALVLVFPDFDKPFLLETDASKEGLGAVLSQKQDDGRYHPVAFGSRTLTPSEQNYHSSKLEFLALKWSVTEHFKDDRYHVL